MSTRREEKLAKREKAYKLTRWRYFCKTLYSNPTKTGKFDFQGQTYFKSDELMDIEEKSVRLHLFLVVAMLALIYCAVQFQIAWLLAVALVVIVAGEIVRLNMLPRDIQSQLTKPKVDKWVPPVVEDDEEESEDD
jgi:hypothetical protein